jgi:carboxylesterase
MKTTRPLLLACCAIMVGACGESPMEYEDWWMDSPAVQDPSLNDPDHLLSSRAGMTAADRARPVVIAVHGFTASTYEWREFRMFAERESEVLVSLVLLGGHGRSVEEFRGSTWRDWGRPILEEYEALVEQGYTNLHIAGSSTGGALILEQIARGAYSGTASPRGFFFIDPIVVPGDKNLTLIPLLKHVVGHLTTDGTDEEKQHWYSNRPAETLAQLHALIGTVRRDLARGVLLPAGAVAKTYKTTGDRTADPVSAVLIYKGLRRADRGFTEVQMLESDLHVFTRLAGRNPNDVTAADRQRQEQAFLDMIQRVRER